MSGIDPDGQRNGDAEAAGSLRSIRQQLRAAQDYEESQENRIADITSELWASETLVAELRESQSALKASEERLSLAFEASGSLGWWDWDVQNNRLHAGRDFARMYGVDPEAAGNGAPLEDFVSGIHPDDRDWVGDRIASVLKHGGEFAEEYRLLRADGSMIWVYARGNCYLDADGRPLRYPGVAIDITARKKSEILKTALVEIGDRLRDAHEVERVAYLAAEVMAKTLGASRAGFGLVDPVNETVMMQPDWRIPGAISLEGLHHFRDYGSFIDDLKRGEIVLIGDVTTDPRTRDNAEALLAIGIRVLINLPVIEHGKFVTVLFVHYDQPHAWTPQEEEFIQSVADRTQAAIGRVRAEEQQRLLNRELSHRLKNNLAMVQAIVTQTLRNSPDIETARSALSNRLLTLGRAHDLLLSADIGGTSLRAVVEGALALHDDGQGRIRMDGPPIEIGAAAALSLSMVLHELATNAAKYGALSSADGHVDTVWRIVPHDDEGSLEFVWRESGGPPVVAPSRRGFGSRLIERGIAGSIGGEVQLDYPTEGVVCRLRATLTGIRES